MLARDLLKPRFEVIADYPKSIFKIGEITNGTDLIYCDPDGPKYSDYPHLFRKMNWWEKRNIEDMPKKLICRAIQNDKEVMDIKEWDMDILVGWTDKDKRECCSLHSFSPEYGYFPVD